MTNYPDSTAPFSSEAEEATLGSVLSNAYAYVEVAAFMKPDFFFLLRHQHIWQAIQRCAERKEDFDYLTVSRQLKNAGHLDDIGGDGYLLRLVSNTPNSMHAVTYARIVEKAAVRRRLLTAADEIKALALNEASDLGYVQTEAEKRLLNAIGTQAELHTAPLKDGVQSVFGYVEELMKGNTQVMGLPTGFRTLDKLLYGLKRGNLVYVAGRPGMGKSAFLLSIAMNVARLNKRVLFWTGEMNADEVAGRALAAESQLSGSDVMAGRLSAGEGGTWSRFVESAGRVSRLPIFIDDTPAISLAALRAAALRMVSRHGLDMLCVDYIGLMRGDTKGNRTQELGELSRGLKALAVELNVPLLCAAQLNREVDKRDNPQPRLSDLRDSGDLEQDANVVMFVYEDTEGISNVYVAKHRGGTCGVVPMLFDKPTTRWMDAVVHEVNLR